MYHVLGSYSVFLKHSGCIFVFFTQFIHGWGIWPHWAREVYFIRNMRFSLYLPCTLRPPPKLALTVESGSLRRTLDNVSISTHIIARKGSKVLQTVQSEFWEAYLTAFCPSRLCSAVSSSTHEPYHCPHWSPIQSYILSKIIQYLTTHYCRKWQLLFSLAGPTRTLPHSSI